LLAFAWGISLVWVRPEDRAAYQRFLKKAEKARVEVSESRQMREGVRKAIWFAQDNGQRLEYRIESVSSTLTFLPVDEKLEIVENLDRIRSSMQFKFYDTGEQEVRAFTADHGTYAHKAQTFVAHDAHLSLFRLPGSLLPAFLNPKEAFLSGIASEVTFSVTGSSPQFEASQFRALLPGERRALYLQDKDSP
jgi:hypothetical protein